MCELIPITNEFDDASDFWTHLFIIITKQIG